MSEGMNTAFVVMIGFAAFATLAVVGPWMLQTLVDFVRQTLISIPTVVG